jgi:hypothetical protein
VGLPYVRFHVVTGEGAEMPGFNAMPEVAPRAGDIVPIAGNRLVRVLAVEPYTASTEPEPAEATLIVEPL